MKLKICLLGLLCLFFEVSAKNKKAIYPLKIGETLPLTTFKNVLNYPSNQINLSDFDNKLVILDFWSTSCGSCIAMLPKQVELQQQFKDKMQIILVDSKNTRDTKLRVINFFKAFHPEYKILPSIVEDTILARYFPHQSVGFYVWLYNGKVMTMADEENITANNIREFLAGHHSVFVMSKDIPYDVHKQIFLNGNGGAPPQFICRSMWASYKQGLHSSSAYSFNDKRLCTGFTTVNSSRYSFCLLAFPQIQAVPYNRLIFKLSDDTTAFLRDGKDELWRLHNLYTYQVSFPAIPFLIALKRIQSDVIHFFHLKIDSNYRDTMCYVIKIADRATQQIREEETDKNGNNGETFIRDMPLTVPLGYLNDKSSIPFVDESGFAGAIKMTYSLDDLTKDQIISKLQQNGFLIEPAIRKLKFYTIAEISEAGQ